MTRKVILEDKDGEELIPYTELATNQQPGRVRPDGSSLVVNSNGVISVNGATGTEIGYLSGVTSGIQGQLNNTVHKTGIETIAGTKTFTNTMITNNIITQGNITLGTSTNTWGKAVEFQDTTGKRIARIQPMAVTTTNNRVGMWVNNADNTNEKGIYIDSDGKTSAPTPPTGDNSSNIATTAYVTNKVSTKADKASFQVVSALPANPDANTFYFIPE